MVDDPDDLPEEEPSSPQEKNYITPAGYRKLVDELEFLHTSKRPEVVSALADAAAEGDRSENAEYIYRKRQLRQIDAVIELLKDARPLCEDAETAGLVGSALDGALTLQHMINEARWPGPPGMSGASCLTGETMPATDPADLCFPV